MLCRYFRLFSFSSCRSLFPCSFIHFSFYLYSLYFLGCSVPGPCRYRYFYWLVPLSILWIIFANRFARCLRISSDIFESKLLDPYIYIPFNWKICIHTVYVCIVLSCVCVYIHSIKWNNFLWSYKICNSTVTMCCCMLMLLVLCIRKPNQMM